jgi:hypothetical protein
VTSRAAISASLLIEDLAMKDIRIAITAASLIVAAATAAQNANPGDRGNTADRGNSSSESAPARGQFTSVDTNKDGRISRTEAQTHGTLGSSFETLDADRDSYLSESEYGKWNGGAGQGQRQGQGQGGQAQGQGQGQNPGSSSSPSGSPRSDQGSSDSSSTAPDSTRDSGTRSSPGNAQ